MKLVTLGDFRGKRVLVRVDYNVPLNKADFSILDDSRIRKSLPTLQVLLDNGASVILCSHLGRPKTGPEDKYSLRHIQDHLSQLLGRSVYFVNDCIGENARTVCEQLQPGDVVLLENTRFYQEEEKGNSEFAKKLSELADCYVNDAFGAAHRAHASTTTVAQFFSEKYAGLLLAAEVENAERVLNTAENPYVAIVGGAKVSDKILIIERLLEKVNTLIIGGGMTYTFLKSQGLEIGKSLCEEEKLDKATELIEKAKKLGVNLVLPVDSVTAEGFSADSSAIVFDNSDLPADRMGLDIGPKSIKNIESALAGAKTILWNGPMGVFEFPAFSSGTFSVARFIAVATQNGAYSLIGGGDSASAVEKAGVADSMSYISTGGGALLEYLEGKILPGVAALD